MVEVLPDVSERVVAGAEPLREEGSSPPLWTLFRVQVPCRSSPPEGALPDSLVIADTTATYASDRTPRIAVPGV